MSEVERFLQEVTLRHGREAEPQVLGEALCEMRLHLEESRDALMSQGMPLAEAEVEAVKAFGDGSAIVPRTDHWFSWRITWKDVSYGLALCAVAGLVAFASALYRDQIREFSPGSDAVLLAAYGTVPVLGIAWGLARRCIPLTATLAVALLPFILIFFPTDSLRSPYRFPFAVPVQRLLAYESALAWHAKNLIAVDTLEAIPDGEAFTVIRNGKQTYPVQVTPSSAGTPIRLVLVEDMSGNRYPGNRFPSDWTPEGQVFRSKQDAVQALRAFRFRLRDLRQNLPMSADTLRLAERQAFYDPITNVQLVVGEVAPFLAWAVGFLTLAQSIGALASRIARRIDQRLRRTRR